MGSFDTLVDDAIAQKSLAMVQMASNGDCSQKALCLKQSSQEFRTYFQVLIFGLRNVSGRRLLRRHHWLGNQLRIL